MPSNLKLPSETEMRLAILERDASYDGQFYYGVITTGVFCKPSCKTKSAKLENIRFFEDVEEAMQHGFRACKRCNPLSYATQTEKLVDIARYIEMHSDEKITLGDLGEMANLSPSRLQKTFKETFGVSPKSYQDAARMDNFKSALKQGEGITDAIYSAGFGSISHVYGEATRNIGMTPKAYRSGGEGEIIHYACRETAIGLMMMAATSKGVCFVYFADNDVTLLDQLKQEFPKADIILSTSQHSEELDKWIDALDKHISQGTPKPDLPLDMRGTAFQIKVWHFLLSIKEGDIYSYSEVAKGIDKPKAIRAVASACGKNRIGILIPCHRVLRNDGSLGGYRWGLERKRALLDKERSNKHAEKSSTIFD